MKEELKTLKDLENDEISKCFNRAVPGYLLRHEASKHIKKLRKEKELAFSIAEKEFKKRKHVNILTEIMYDVISERNSMIKWIKKFFNITEKNREKCIKFRNRSKIKIVKSKEKLRGFK